MNVIFLDIDGVMVTGRVMTSFHGVFPPFDRACVACLNNLIERTGARIVISSTWRWAHPKHIDLHAYLKEQGVKGEIEDMTPRETANSRGRGDDILAWLKSRKDIESFVILDDDDDMLELGGRLVQTKFNEGLTPVCVEEAVDIMRHRYDG